MPRPLLPDSIPQVLKELRSQTARAGGGSGLLEVGDPAGPPTITNLGLTSTVETDVHGRDTATILAQWDPVPAPTGESADPAQAPVKDYLVGISTDGGSSFSADQSTEATAARFTGLRVGRVHAVRVRARTTAGVAGPYATAFITTATDNGAPGKPSTPIVSGSAKFLKAIQVEWDGVIAGGVPNDLRHLELWGSKTSPPSAGGDAAYIGNIDKTERRYTYPTPDYGTYYFQFRAVDTSGNKGPFSDVSAGAKGEQVVNDDLAESVVVNSRAAGTFGGGNGVLNSSFDMNAPTGNNPDGSPNGGGPDPFRHWTTVQNASAQTGGSFHKARNDRYARLTRSGGAVALLASNRIPISEPGEKIVTAWVRLNAAGLTPRVDLYNPGGAQPVLADIQPSEYRLDSNLVGTWQRIATAYKSSVVGPSDGSQDHVTRVLIDSGPNGSVDVDAVQYELGDYATAYAPNVGELGPGTIGRTEIGPNSVSSEKIIAGSIVSGKIQADAIGANEIRAGAITAGKAHLEDAVVLRAKIRDLAVDNAKIADASITSLKVAEVTAERITTGTLRSSTRIIAGDPGGSRVEIDYDGIRLITTRNGYHETTVALDRATGQGRFQGEIRASTITGSTIRTGDSGNYIRLSDLSQRDKIQFIRNDPGFEYVSGTLTSITGGIQIDGSDGSGGPGRILVGSTNGDKLDCRARRVVRSETAVRLARPNVQTNSSGWADVAFDPPFPAGMSVTSLVLTVDDNPNGAPVTCGFTNLSNTGFRVYFYSGSHQRVSASRFINVYAESTIRE